MSAISFTNPQLSAPTPSTTPNPKLQAYFKERQPEVRQLAEALKSGNVSAAEKAYNNLVALGNTVLHKDNPFLLANRALDFNAIGGALQNGDLDGARQAFSALQHTFHRTTIAPPPSLAGDSGAPPATVMHLSAGVAPSNTNDLLTAAEGGVNLVA
jgi:hypothetical protein